MLSDDTPFPHQGPLAPDRVRGRDDLVADLVERVTGRRMTALLGPRRFGKTTVLGAVATTLEQAGTSVIRLDLYETRSAADLVVRLDRALAAGRGGIRGRLSSLAVASSVNLGVLKLEFSRPPSQRPDADASLDLLLDLLVEAAAQEPTLLVIDEFTGINGVAGAAGLLRTKLQHHVQEIGVLFAGSEPSAMAAMFTEQSQPFYAQADLVEIHPFSLAQLTDIVDGGFTSTGRRSDGLAGLVHHATAGHPYRSMQLADAAWVRTEPGGSGAAAWAEARRAVQRGVAPGLEVLFSTFTHAEQVVLRALATGRPLFGGTLELFGASSGAVQAARNRLVGNGTLTRDLTIVDPMLSDWIRTTLPL
jgi:uncharacterized protein